MAGTTETFPDVPLTSEQDTIIYGLCGGNEPDLENLRAFLKGCGQHAIPDEWFRTYLQNVGLSCLDALGVDIALPAARINLNRGILYYTGTMKVLGADDELPHNGEALSRIEEGDKQLLGMEALQTAQGMQRFRNVLGRFSRQLGTVGEREGFEVALVGAGLAHVVRAESLAEDAKPTKDAPEQEMTTEEYARGLIANLEMKELNEKRVYAPLPRALSADPRGDLAPLPNRGEKDKRRVKLDEPTS